MTMLKDRAGWYRCYTTKKTNEIICIPPCVLRCQTKEWVCSCSYFIHSRIECFLHCLRLNLTHFRFSFSCSFSCTAFLALSYLNIYLSSRHCNLLPFSHLVFVWHGIHVFISMQQAHWETRNGNVQFIDSFFFFPPDSFSDAWNCYTTI